MARLLMKLSRGLKLCSYKKAPKSLKIYFERLKKLLPASKTASLERGLGVPVHQQYPPARSPNAWISGTPRKEMSMWVKR